VRRSREARSGVARSDPHKKRSPTLKVHYPVHRSWTCRLRPTPPTPNCRVSQALRQRTISMAADGLGIEPFGLAQSLDGTAN